VIDSAPPMPSGPSVRSSSGSASGFSVGFGVVASLAIVVPAADAQQPIAVEYAFPSQLVRGQTTVIHWRFRGARFFRAPSIAVGRCDGVRRHEQESGQSFPRTSMVGRDSKRRRDAMPGSRALALLTAAGRTVPVMVVIPTHAPVISDLRIVPASGNQRAVEVQLAAVDESADLVSCRTSGLRSRAERADGGRRERKDHRWPRARVVPRPAAAACDLELRVSDAQKIDSKHAHNEDSMIA